MRSAAYKKDLVKRYVNNQCASGEVEEFFLLLEKGELDTILREYIDEDAQRSLLASREVSASLSEDMLQNILVKIQTTRSGDKIINKFRVNNFYRIAAAITLFIISTGVLFHFFTQHKTIMQSTDYGETATFQLPDSSHVTLNGNSKISYASNWQEENQRDIQLQGEAFFNVKNKPDHQKFVVHTSNGLHVEVLGTQFNVNHRRGKTRVVLNEGKIKLNWGKTTPEKASDAQGTHNIYMEPGELAEYSEKQQDINKKIVNPQLYTSWRNNKLIFKDTPLQEIFQILEDNYGYQVLLEDEAILQEKFTATYPADDIEILLQALEKSFDLKISRDASNRLIIKQNSKKSP